jgi:hypothetical protein
VKERRAVHSPADLQAVLECESCLLKIPPPEIQKTQPSIGHNNTVRMADRLRYVNRLLASRNGFDELPELSQRYGYRNPGKRESETDSKALTNHWVVKGH